MFLALSGCGVISLPVSPPAPATKRKNQHQFGQKKHGGNDNHHDNNQDIQRQGEKDAEEEYQRDEAKEGIDDEAGDPLRSFGKSISPGKYTSLREKASFFHTITPLYATRLEEMGAFHRILHKAENMYFFQVA